jgi:hypothetical protein
MDDKHFRRSKNIEDRRDEGKLKGYGGGLLAILKPKGTASEYWDQAKELANNPLTPYYRKVPASNGALSKAAGTADLDAEIDRKEDGPADFKDRFNVDRGGARGGDSTSGTAPQSFAALSNPVHDAIVKAATEDGVDPAYALAVAQRESNFNPAARSSKSIAGIYQMRGDLRAKYGSGDSADPYTQAKGWTKFIPDVKSDMGSVLGRDVSDPESYLGHHFGAKRAARMLKMDPSTPVDAVFSPQEMGLNPHFARAGTVGNLNASVMGDIGQRMARFGGGSSASLSAEPADLSSFGEPVETSGLSPDRHLHSGELPDLSSYGEPVEAPSQAQPPPPDLSQYGTAVNE